MKLRLGQHGRVKDMSWGQEESVHITPASHLGRCGLQIYYFGSKRFKSMGAHDRGEQQGLLDSCEGTVKMREIGTAVLVACGPPV